MENTNKQPKQEQEMDLIELMQRFGDEDKCRAYLELLRFPNGVFCIRCQSSKISRIRQGDRCLEVSL